MSLFGKIKNASTAGIKAWKEHDASQTWSDGGASQQIADHLKGEIDALVYAQVKEAVFEHAKDGTWFMGVDKDGQLLVGIDLGNDAAPLLVRVPLRRLINAVLEETFGTIANPASQDVMSALAAFARDMSGLANRLHNQHPGESPEPPVPPRRANGAGARPGGKVITRGLPPTPEEAQ